MLDDILTVVWKERRGITQQRGSRKRALFSVITPVAVLGIYFPWSIGADWLGSPWSLLISLLVPALLVGMAIPESFAGERERHTLSTLLASRLPDRAILFGKMLTAILYGWLAALTTHLLSLIVVNIAHWDGSLMFYAPTMATANIFLSLLVAGVMAAGGVLISLRSATVQGATQALMIVMMAPLILVQIGGAIVLSVRGEALQGLRDFLETVNVPMTILIGALVLAVLCTGLTLAAMRRFRRARLILD